MWTPTFKNCDDYLNARKGTYENRAVRYRAAINEMFKHGLDDNMTVYDIGAGWTEFDYCLRKEFDWRGRYIPIDGGIDDIDLNYWSPPRQADWFVALEILEHLKWWDALVDTMKERANKGIVVSTPNPYATDVLGMDETHVTSVWPQQLAHRGLYVKGQTFYGRTFNLPGKEHLHDSLLGVWTRP